MTRASASLDDGGRVAVFDSDFRAVLDRRFGQVDENVRPLVHATALAAERGALRAWLDTEVDRLDAAQLPHVLGQLRGDETHHGAVAELAALATLRDAAGLDVTLDPRLDDLTPDLLATDLATRDPVLVAEVCSRAVTAEVVAEQRRWNDLARAIARIRSTALLSVRAAGFARVGAPDAAEVKSIVDHLSKYLTHGSAHVGWTTTYLGLVFQVVGRTQGHALMVPVTAARTIDRDHVIDMIERKVHKYRRLVLARRLPFIVVLASEPRTGLGAPLVESVLAGTDSLVFEFDNATTGDMHARRHQLRRTDAKPLFDPALAAVGFVDVRDGADAVMTIWPIDGAPHPVPALPSGPRLRLRPATGASRR